MKTLLAFLILTVISLSGCSYSDQTPPSSLTPETTTAKNSNIPKSKPVWSATKSSTFTSNFFNLKLTVPPQTVAHGDQSIDFTWDSWVEIDEDGNLTLSSPALVGYMKATKDKSVQEFLNEESAHNHRGAKIEEFVQDGKSVTHYSFLTNCEGYEVSDNIYVVEHKGYLLEFVGHECQDLEEIVKTLEFMD